MLVLPLSVTPAFPVFQVLHLMVGQEVRFKGNGLESIEVQDNGTGISSDNYATIGK